MAGKAVSKDAKVEVLRGRFALQQFRASQSRVIDAVLEGRNAAALFPTGGGKSLCYQLPAVMLDGLTVVVSPLIALMKDQVEQLQKKGIEAARLDSTLTTQEYRGVLQSVRSGTTKILYAAPERFFNESFRQFLSTIPISLFAVDEAHCVSQWGHSFRPEYLKIAKLATELKAQRTLALTATATPAVLADICREFSIATEDAVIDPFYRENLHLRFTLTTAEEARDELVEKLRTRRPGPTIIYVTLQNSAMELAAFLEEKKFSARPYHAGLDDAVRSEVQDWFMSSDDGIVVATIAFGMGIDKADIRYVYHFNPPKSLENYAQEIGRAGRDGNISICESLIVPADRIVLENFVFGDTPSFASIKLLLQQIPQDREQFYFSLYRLSQSCDVRDLVTRITLTYLELDRFIEALSPRYEQCQLKPLVTSAEILSHFTGEKQQFIKSVLAQCVKQKTWFDLDIEKAASNLKCERSRIVSMLEFLKENGWLETKMSGLLHGYRVLKKFESIELMAEMLHQRLGEKEAGDIEKLDQWYEVAQGTTCQAAELSRYFGQPLDKPCGNCSHCRGEAIQELDLGMQFDLPQNLLPELKKLASKHPQELGDARQKAKLLCGINSPKLVRAKLQRDKLFGACSHIPFEQVLEAVAI